MPSTLDTGLHTHNIIRIRIKWLTRLPDAVHWDVNEACPRASTSWVNVGSTWARSSRLHGWYGFDSVKLICSMAATGGWGYNKFFAVVPQAGKTCTDQWWPRKSFSITSVALLHDAVVQHWKLQSSLQFTLLKRYPTPANYTMKCKI